MRKFTLFTIALFCIAFASQAQIEKGAVLLGGNISGYTSTESNSTSTSEDKYRTFNFSPSIGFVTANNKVWGFKLTYGSSLNKHNETEYYDYNRYGGGVFYRRYATLGKGFYLFAEADVNYSYSKQKELNGTGDSRTTRIDNVSVSIYPGITYAVHKKLHLEAVISNLLNLGYSNQKRTDISSGTGSTTTQKSFSFSSNVSSSNPLSIGFRFLL